MPIVCTRTHRESNKCTRLHRVHSAHTNKRGYEKSVPVLSVVAKNGPFENVTHDDCRLQQHIHVHSRCQKEWNTKQNRNRHRRNGAHILAYFPMITALDPHAGEPFGLLERSGELCGYHFSWWRHQMETFSALLAICAGNSPVPGEIPTDRPVTRSFDVFFDLRLINDWVNNREAGDLRRHVDHYDVSVMCYFIACLISTSQIVF